MSRLIDRLKRASRSELQPMGFRKTAGFEKPRLLLVAEVKEGAAARVVEGADAVLLEGAIKNPPVEIDLPVGMRLSGGKVGQAKGLDFVVFTPEMPIAAVKDEKVGKVMALEASLEMGMLKALEDLPIDALFITGEGVQAVNWQYLMLCWRLSAVSSKPVLVAVPPDIGQEELQLLWDAGVDGIVVAAKTADGLKKLRSMIDGLILPAEHKQMKARGIVPSLAEAATPAIEDDEYDEE